MSEKAKDTIRILKSDLERAKKAAGLVRAIVDSVSGGLVTIRRLGNTTAESEQYARLAGFALAEDDEVAVAHIGGVPLVLGKIQRGPAEVATLEAGAIIGSADSDEATIKGHLRFDGAAPSVAAGAAAGTGPSATIAGTDNSFRVTLTTGSDPSTGALFTVTFATAMSDAEYMVTWGAFDTDAAAAMTSLYVSNRTTTAITFSARVALPASTSHLWMFHVFEGV